MTTATLPHKVLPTGEHLYYFDDDQPETIVLGLKGRYTITGPYVAVFNQQNEDADEPDMETLEFPLELTPETTAADIIAIAINKMVAHWGHLRTEAEIRSIVTFEMLTVEESSSAIDLDCEWWG